MATTIRGSDNWDSSLASNVVHSSSTTPFATTSATPVDVPNFSVTITPSSVNSKILIFVSFRYGNSASGANRSLLFRNSTGIYIGGSNNLSNIRSAINNDQGFGQSSFSYLDSPSSTSALTYKLQVTRSGGTLQINNRNDGEANSNHIGSITAMEIAG
tara:strand:+ start:997 stop:1470 length:474 start_codon:yes stop_codon:yes gene_type:complete